MNEGREIKITPEAPLNLDCGRAEGERVEFAGTPPSWVRRNQQSMPAWLRSVLNRSRRFAEEARPGAIAFTATPGQKNTLRGVTHE